MANGCRRGYKVLNDVFEHSADDTHEGCTDINVESNVDQMYSSDCHFWDIPLLFVTTLISGGPVSLELYSILALFNASLCHVQNLKFNGSISSGTTLTTSKNFGWFSFVGHLTASRDRIFNIVLCCFRSFSNLKTYRCEGEHCWCSANFLFKF